MSTTTSINDDGELWIPEQLRNDVDEVLIPADRIAARLGELAAEVDRDYAGRDTDLLLVGVLRGAVFTLSDLARRLTIPSAIDFMACSSYGSSTT